MLVLGKVVCVFSGFYATDFKMLNYISLWAFIIVAFNQCFSLEIGPNVCVKQETYMTTETVSYSKPHQVRYFTYCLAIPPRCSKYRVAYTTDYKTQPKVNVRTVIECCKGFVRTSDGSSCIPICSNACIHGICIGPDECECQPGFGGPTCNVSICSNACIHGICIGPDECECQPGFDGPTCNVSCPVGKYGVRCERDCICNNQDLCDPVTGGCSCKPEIRCTKFPDIDMELLTVYYEDNDIRVGSRASFKCRNNDQTLKGTDVAVCLRSGEWSSEPPQCTNREELRCARFPDINMELLTVYYEDNDSRAGSRAIFNCRNNDLTLSGTKVAVCLRSGEWSSLPPQCTSPDIRCKRFLDVNMDLLNVYYEDSSVRVGSRVTFNCRSSDHTLNGTSVAVCLRNREWSSPPPKCMKNSLTDGFPKFIREPNRQDTDEGHSVLLQCQVEGDPEPTVIWLKNMIPLDMSIPRYSLVQGYSLQITDAKVEDAGIYECMAKNSHGSALSAKVTLFVKERLVPPYFSITPKNLYDVFPGSALNITCVADGSPIPFVSWRKGLTNITHDGAIPSGRSILVLTDISESANYTCIAASKLGDINATAQVVVHAPPKPPTNIQIVEKRSTSIRLAWSYDTGSRYAVIYFVIQFKPKQSSQEYPGEIHGITTQFYTVRYLNPNTEYEFYVFAVTVGGRSSRGTPVFATTEETL